MATVADKISEYTDQLHRLIEFHKFLNSNVLFPHVPDKIVHPLKDRLMEAEHELVKILYDHGAIDKAATIHKMLGG